MVTVTLGPLPTFTEDGSFVVSTATVTVSLAAVSASAAAVRDTEADPVFAGIAMLDGSV